SITPAVSPFAVARERGYYRQEGLDVQLVVIPSALGMQAMLGGNVKFATAADPARRSGALRVHLVQPADVLAVRPPGDPRRGRPQGKKSGRLGDRQRPRLAASRNSEKIQIGGR